MDKIAQEILISEGLHVDVITNLSDEQLFENIINPKLYSERRCLMAMRVKRFIKSCYAR